MIALGLILHVVGDICDRDILSFLVIVDVSLHLEEIHNTFEVVLFSDGKLTDNSVLAELRPDLIHRVEEVRSHYVHLVYESHTGNVVFVCLTPYVFRLGLNTALCVENAYCAVKYTERPLNLHREIHVSGGIDDIDPVL